MENFSKLFRNLLVIMAVFTLGACAQLASTSSAPEDREKMISSSRCSVNYNRLRRFVEYYPPGSESLKNIYAMYRQGYLGVRGYDTLGDVYYHGCPSANLNPSRSMAAMWYEYAALGHVAEAQYKFGRMLFQGDGIPENKELGIQWLTSAAIEGNRDARQFLQGLGQEAPPEIGPNTYETLEAEHARARRHERADWFKSAAGDILGLGIVAVTTVAYSAAYVAAAQAGHTAAPATQFAPEPIVIERYAPRFCSTTANIIVTGGPYSAFANGTSATFCY